MQLRHEQAHAELVQNPKPPALHLHLAAMQLLHFVAAWLFPGAAVCAAAKVATKATAAAESFEPDTASSPAFSIGAADDSPGSSVSSSSSSSSSSDDHPRFFTSPRQHSTLASPLCFGAGAGAGRLFRRSRGDRARSPTKQEAAAAAASTAPAIKGDVVARYLRKFSRRLRTARNASEVSPPSPVGAIDDTARERAESVARAISCCKDTLRRGATPPPPPPSPSLDEWLHDTQGEIMESAAAARCNGSTDSESKSPAPQRPRRHGGLAEMMQPTGRQQCKEAMRPASPSPDSSICTIAVGVEHDDGDALDNCRGEAVTLAETAMLPSLPLPSDDLLADELETTGRFDEMEFLKIFEGDEEMIGHHFITVQI